MAITCAVPNPSRRRLFWTTKADACGVETSCTDLCGRPGLVIAEPLSTDPPGSVRLSADGWIHSLVVNMLLTDGRKPDSACGYRPGGQGGHWSESYGAGAVGSLIRTIPNQGRIQDSINLVVAFAQATLERLVDRGVASAVSVTGRYLGNAKMVLDVVVTGQSGETTRVGVSGSRISEGWVWA